MIAYNGIDFFTKICPEKIDANLLPYFKNIWERKEREKQINRVKTENKILGGQIIHIILDDSLAYGEIRWFKDGKEAT